MRRSAQGLDRPALLMPVIHLIAEYWPLLLIAGVLLIAYWRT
jgi:hypothetical protein